LEVAKSLIGVPQDQEINLVEYPMTVPFLKKYLATKKPAENSDQQDKQKAFAQVGSSFGFVLSLLSGGSNGLLTRFFTLFFGNSGASVLRQVSNMTTDSGPIGVVDHTADTISL
jgi:hypothetical protein